MNMILGQFYPTGSILERLDPRTKILCTIIYIVTVFCCDSPITYGLCIGFFAGMIIVSRLHFKLLLGGLKGIIFILLFTGIMNLFFISDGRVLIDYAFITITTGGVIATAKICIRIFLLIMFSSMLTLTTKPVQLTVAFEKLLYPFTKIGLPSHEVAMMMGIALRFIPTLVEELDKIKKAQMARGASFDEGSFAKRVTANVPVIIPLFVSSFKRADDLAMAMEARCYRGGTNRTRLNNPVLGSRDYISFVFVIVFMIFIICLEYFI